ncbi:stalk domain-containing protein [Paenibacillus sepulcri]|uniref:DUF3298 domain-containing protein n=1 Tax=Paenibacillus sepulcri TaxID=359917 RepID=A0ABS7BY00_9BACL|nr:DUF3298 domain-containing protein [Paenibacillus sepulcri]
MTQHRLTSNCLKILVLGAISSLMFHAGTPLSFASGNGIADTIDVGSPLANQKTSAIKVSAKTIKTISKTYTANVQYPVIAGLRSTQYQGELNYRISELARQDLEAVKKQAASGAAEAIDAGIDFIPYDITVKYEVMSDGSPGNSNYLSIKVLTYLFTGGAHGITRMDTYNIRNSDKPSLITLKDLFGADYKAVINKKVKEEIASNPDHYFQDAFTGITDDQTFYVKGGDAYIVFQNYEIAPYAAGLPEIKVPYAGDSSSGGGQLISLPVFINGVKLDLGQAPLFTNESGIVMAPLRPISAALGYKLNWKEASQQAKLFKGSQLITATVGKDSYISEKNALLSLETAPVIKNGTLYVPLAFYSELLQAKVAYTATAVMITA